MYKVLVANRDEYDTKGMEWLLHSSLPNCLVKTVGTEREVIKKIEDFQPHVLIFELGMISNQYMEDFVRVTKIIKPTIIALTTEATFAQAKKAIDIGVKDLLLKPISPEILLKSVQKLFRQFQSLNKTESISVDTFNDSVLHYKELLLESKESAANYISIGMKTENSQQLSNLYSYLEGYPFKNKVQAFILSDMIMLVSEHKKNFSWRNECNRFLRDWQERSIEPLAIIIYSKSEYSRNLHQQYVVVNQLMELTFYLGFKQIIEAQEWTNWEFIDPFLTPDEQRMWIHFLNQSDIDGVKSWLYQEFLHYKEPYPDPGLVRIRLTSILAQMRRHMKTYQLIEERYEKKYLTLFQSILYSPVIYRIIDEIILFISSIFEAIKNNRGLKLDLADRIVHTLEKKYWDSGLTLDKVADELGRNPNYLSTVLMNKWDKSFRQILNDIRIEQSKKLLIETDLSIKEISYMCGYKNQQYFNRVFQKLLNIQPSQFRKNGN
ncbi:helix-turn-helix domain-containing protein [Bacillus sp. 31A1R]|uniref:Helix-turn-helix domain-containing protein n=1 Tax=Robertmurraya mangrovi TaxID=3098077 RepID=A0ABU5IVR4_9BACI|nr:helix-turn-helix domain-containing protein [Bacillus sp. 31A1R]MDZ5471232.1 helix-turn-helix domain-containing protein [Bacillus sp. 31A1R]